jgi:hypothetical protein
MIDNRENKHVVPVSTVVQLVGTTFEGLSTAAGQNPQTNCKFLDVGKLPQFFGSCGLWRAGEHRIGDKGL